MASQKINRRSFLGQSSGVALLIGSSGLLATAVSCADPKKLNHALVSHEVTAWVKLAEDGQITIYNPAAEMGQGSMTALPLLFAEEMDADWSKVKVEFSPQESEIYGSPGWRPGTKLMFTVGSRTTKSYYEVMRRAGAQARYVLLTSAAKMWEVPIDQLDTEHSMITHSPSGRSISYGELASHLHMPTSLPEYTLEDMKTPDQFNLIGTEVARTDIPAKVNGSAQFALDIRLPDMLYAVLERGNLHGATPTLQNSAEIENMSGVRKIVLFDYAIGIVADSLEEALAAKKHLDIQWSSAEASGFNSQEVYDVYEDVANQGKTGTIKSQKGDVDLARRQAAKVYQADFKNDYVYHAQMEPLNAIVQVAEDGQHAEVWVGSQQGADTKLGIPNLLGIPSENVSVHLQYLGGGFGRRSMSDFVIECGTLAKEMAPHPVKLLWTREDDLGYGTFRPLSLQRLRVSVDGLGRLTGLDHCVVGDGGNLVASGASNNHYDIPNLRVAWREQKHGIRLKHWRAVGHGPNKFAIECMLDEVALDQGVDPVALRRRLMTKSPRALATLEKAAQMSGWDSPPAEGRARGVAFAEHGSMGTGVCEISIDAISGKIKVHRFWVALDAGVIVHPDNVRAQIEGGIIMGMSSVLKEQVTVLDGYVQQSNFHDYQLLRMEDVPDAIEIALIESTEHPEGVGETTTPIVGGAIANAFLRLTGKRLRHLPFSPERVKQVLAVA
ncbi:MAG: molybdopterin-dependent oxidoreductase [Saprospiraceae bacterium]|nr:molybdopterin-dependent oxidoreductase [Saprospiraceae bacterium]